MHTTQVTYWKAYRNGVLMYLGRSEERLRKRIKARHRYKKRKWEFVSVTEDAAVVEGEIHDWSAEGGCGGVKVHWHCPYCDMQHWYDVEPTDDGTYLYGCFRDGRRTLILTAGAGVSAAGERT
jgi:hypothetical protein